MKFPLTGCQFIAGQTVSSPGLSLRAVNPAKGETLEPAFAHAIESEVDAAMCAAQRAFAVTRDLTVERRVALLEAIAAQILALGDELLLRAHAETALSFQRLEAERARTCFQFKHFADTLREGSWVNAVIDTAEPQRQPAAKPDLRRMARPIGPVVVFGAGNFPFAYGACGGDTASALAAGNPVVVKAHERHPGVNELFARAMIAALEQCDLPQEIFSLLQGPGITVGQALVKHPAARAVGFTGSKRAGRVLADLAAARPAPIPVFAEMGSVNPVVMLPGAVAERGEAIAAGLAQSITAGAGQFCTKPGLVFLAGDADEFVAELVRQMSAVSATTMLAAEMRQNFGAAIESFRAISGVRTLLANEPSGFADMKPQLLEVDSAIWREQDALREEAFGPGAIVVRCRDVGDLMATIPLVGGSLTGALHAGAADAAAEVRSLAQALEQIAGRVIFNGFPTGVEVCAAMVHGGPYPATTAPASSSVGALAMQRFVRPVAFQNMPDALLPEELQSANPSGIWRLVNGRWTRDAVG